MGPAEATITWIDRIELGSAHLSQARAAATSFPPISQLPPASQPLVHLGGPRLMRLAPVLDLRSRRLGLRGAPARPLASPSEGVSVTPEIVSLAIEPFAARWPIAALDVRVEGSARSARVILDAGFAVLRLTLPALERLWLPLERAAWMARDAVPITLGGVGGGAQEELLVQIGELALGPLVYRRPWVVIALGDSDGQQGEGLLGAGALLPFARVGLDLAGGRLELEPGSEMTRAADGRWFVPAPGALLGLGLQEGEGGPGDAALPLVNLILRGSPAEKAGIGIGARLLAIDGQPSSSIPFRELCRRLWPSEDTTLTLTLRGPGAGEERTVRFP